MKEVWFGKWTKLKSIDKIWLWMALGRFMLFWIGSLFRFHKQICWEIWVWYMVRLWMCGPGLRSARQSRSSSKSNMQADICDIIKHIVSMPFCMFSQCVRGVSTLSFCPIIWFRLSHPSTPAPVPPSCSHCSCFHVFPPYLLSNLQPGSSTPMFSICAFHTNSIFG